MKYIIRRNSEPNSGNWERDTLEKLLLEAYREQRRARIWKLIFRLLLIAFLALYLFAIFGNIGSLNPAAAGPHTAVIRLEGAITAGENQASKLRQGLEAAYKNKQVRGIIIRANSPGGSPVVSGVAYREIRRLRAEHPGIPVYVVAEDMCASGCYYIAAAADKIYADQSSIVGSIGVVGSSFDLTGLMHNMGIQRRQRTAGSNKGMGDPFTPETPAQTQIWESMLGDIHQEFIKAVKLGRGARLKDKQYPDVFSGRIYTGKEAKQVGLIDDFGSIYSVARDVVKAPGLVNYTPQDDFSKMLSRRFGAEVKAKVKETLSEIW